MLASNILSIFTLLFDYKCDKKQKRRFKMWVLDNGTL